LIINGSKMRHLEFKRGRYLYRKGTAEINLGKDQAEALRLWAELEADPAKLMTARIVGVLPLRMRFRPLCDRFIAAIEGQRPENTVRTYRRAVNALCRVFGNSLVREIDRPSIIAYHRELCRDTPYEANMHIRVMSIVLQDAVDRGEIQVNPAFRIKKSEESRHELILSVEILWNKIYPAADPLLKRGIMLAWNFVQHENEVLNMQWAHFDEQNCIVRFPRQKTGKRITINYGENAAFRRFLESLKAEIAATGESSPYLICRPINLNDGSTGWKSVPSLNDNWHRAMKIAGVKGYKFKEIRHLANTLLKDSGIGADQRCKLTGHSSTKTNEVYTHESGTDTIEASRVLGEVGV
jgi:integrase